MKLSSRPIVIVSGDFDDLRSPQVRFLEEASRFGNVNIFLYSDEYIFAQKQKTPKFPMAERRYLLEALRYVNQVIVGGEPTELDITSFDDIISENVNESKGNHSLLWVVKEADEAIHNQARADRLGIDYRVIKAKDLGGFPLQAYNNQDPTSSKKKVIVTGCYDWLHSGHVRFFEEAAQFGDLYVIVGSDENVRFLKGAGHPLFSQEQRCYIVQAIRYVKQALISSGQGWMDAEPEIELIQPDIYLVNEDGDKPEKRAFCARRGLEYIVLKRLPKDGLAKRESTQLRGF